MLSLQACAARAWLERLLTTTELQEIWRTLSTSLDLYIVQLEIPENDAVSFCARKADVWDWVGRTPDIFLSLLLWSEYAGIHLGGWVRCVEDLLAEYAPGNDLEGFGYYTANVLFSQLRVEDAEFARKLAQLAEALHDRNDFYEDLVSVDILKFIRVGALGSAASPMLDDDEVRQLLDRP